MNTRLSLSCARLIENFRKAFTDWRSDNEPSGWAILKKWTRDEILFDIIFFGLWVWALCYATLVAAYWLSSFSFGDWPPLINLPYQFMWFLESKIGGPFVETTLELVSKARHRQSSANE